MKKTFATLIVVLMTACFVSCGNTEMCYEITATYKVAGIELKMSNAVITTKNHIKEAESELKETIKSLGAPENTIKISSRIVPDSNCK